MTVVRGIVILMLLAGAILIGGCSRSSITEQLPLGALGKYYIDFTDVAREWDGPFDEQGIPLYDYGSAFGIQYQPVSIGQYALGNWDLYLNTGQAEYRETFLRMADWFYENLVVNGAFGVWEYHFDFPRFQLKAPWPSAMAQGEGISVLARAYENTQESRYLECAELALNSFRTPLEEGGVRYRDEARFIWYEEYPSLVEPPHVLNGFIFALFGLYDLYKATGSEEALGLFNEGIETLKANLGRWDLGCWSRYDLTDLYALDTFLFRFVVDRKHPDSPHPIDEIVLHTHASSDEASQTVLDVGAPDDVTDVSVNGSYLYYSPGYEDWGEPYQLDGRSVRNYEDRGGRWAHAPFEFVLDLQPHHEYSLEINYKDVQSEPVYVELYADGVKYIRFATLEHAGDGAWKTAIIGIPFELLLLKEGTSSKYQEIHIQQLEVLSQITTEDVFEEYAKRFATYLRAVTSNLQWHEMLDAIREGL